MDKRQTVRDFYDRDYPRREAYRRLWAYIRPYKVRLFLGILCGMLTAGTLVPMFQLVQPATKHIEQMQGGEPPASLDSGAPSPQTAPAPAQTAQERKISRELASAERFAKKLGIELVDANGVMHGGIVVLILIVLPVVAGLRLALKFCNQYLLSWTGTHATMDLSCDLLRHTQKQSLEFFSRVDVGRLMQRVIVDAAEVRNIVQSVIADLAEAPFEIAVSIGYIVWYAISNRMIPTLVILLVAFPLFAIPIRTCANRIRKWTRNSLMRSSMVLGRVHEVLTCIRLVKSSDSEAGENARFREANRSLVKSSLRAIRLQELVRPMMEFIGIALICLFVCWCFWKNITLDQVLPMLAPLLVIYKPTKKLAKLQVIVETSMAALSRIWSLQDLHMEISERPGAVDKRDFKGSIRFENVSFRYTTQERDAVRGASFEIPKGSKVAVVGGTGSGKSTLAALLARFADPRDGRITIDGTDIRDMTLSGLRSLIGIVNQETLLFNEPVAYNIAYGRMGATEGEVQEAARKASAHDFVSAHPDGYARLCGEKGFALSGGERQRVSIAAAMLRNSPILILDEATSALDTVTERQVQDALGRLMENRTTFVIAHRLSTVRDADLILVMQDGEIVERGTHDALYAAGGAYRKLCDMQKNG